MSSYHYKPAALGSDQTVSWSDEGLSLTKKDETQTLAWSDVSSVRHWSMRLKTIDYYCFVVTSADGRKIELNLNMPEGMHFDNPLFKEYFAMLLGVSEMLKAHNPELKVDYGQPPKYAWIYFVMGVICTGFALVMLLLLVTERSDRMEAALPPVGIMALLGVFLMWTFRPWRKRVQISLDGMTELARIRAFPDQR